MGFSHKSHGKRSDKETQSPMLKVFKDMVQKERRDPEKTTLLNDTRVDRQRKHYSGSRSKSGHRTVSSSSERVKNNKSYVLEQRDLNKEFDACPSQSLPFQGEKRDSWWFWGEKDMKSKAEDTCSCVSCALKKLISTDYACIICIILLLVVSVAVAIMLVYNSIPCMDGDDSFKGYKKNGNPKIEIERLKRRIGGKWDMKTKKPWESPFTRSYDPAFDSFKLQDSAISNYVDSDSELSRILDAEKINDMQTSDRLRDFYQKLIQTDAAIRNLRKTLNINTIANTDNSDFNINNFLRTKDDFSNKYDLNSNDLSIPISKFYPDRKKRSLKLFHRPMKLINFRRSEQTTKSKIERGKLITTTTVNMTSKKPATNKSFRNKRSDKDFDPEELVIEKNKVVIQYNPRHVVAKCSHTPKDSKSHETQMNHPFYKNTQRFEELLDQFMDKKLPDLFTDTFEIKTMPKDKYEPTNEEASIKEDYNKKTKGSMKSHKDQNVSGIEIKNTSKEPQEGKIKQVAKKAFENEFFDDLESIDTKGEGSSTTSYDILLSISTILNPRASSDATIKLIDGKPNLRKLMQINAKEEEGLTYQDIKEVLVDYKEGQDNEHKESDRKRRNIENIRKEADPGMKLDITGIHNRNWKGPMPLYPEELIQGLKQNKNSKVAGADNAHLSLTDTEYVEDYLDNGYEKLAQLAQSYSDYGVLNEKKESNVDKKTNDKVQQKFEDRKVRLVNGLKSGLKRGIKKSPFFGRYTKASQTSEGIRIEVQPTTQSRVEDSFVNFKDIFNKHIKISNSSPKPNEFSAIPQRMLTMPLKNNEQSEKMKPFENENNDNVSSDIYKRRTLKAVLLKNDINNEDGTIDAACQNIIETKPTVSSKFKRDTDRDLQDKVDDLYKFNTFDNISVIDETKSENPANIINSTTSEGNMTISNFFMLLSNWFSALHALEKNSSQEPPIKDIENTRAKTVKADNLNYSIRSEALPLYDSDIIENSGHRSRVLLSFETINNTKQADNRLQSDDHLQSGNHLQSPDHKLSDDNEGLHLEAFTTTESMKNTNNTIMVIEVTEPMINYENETNIDNHKVKRQAIDDSNLIFWNDLYDDEYGIKSDSLDTNIRDKHSVDRNDFLKKSNTWLRDKVKQITKKFSNLGSSNDKAKVKGDGVKYPNKRHAVFGSDDEHNFGKVDFPKLTAKMKEVCKKTAKAVHKSKHVEVRGDGKDGGATNSLMQQLVRLMSDLVDFQVQERTCRTLPPDLQQFLEWLTGKKDDDDDQADVNSYYSDEKTEEYSGVSFDKATEQDLLQPSENEDPYSRTDCLGTLQAVQALIRQYDDMSDYDKSIMTGVKDYLEHQASFLQKHISALDDVKLNIQDSARFRRDTDTIKAVTSKYHATVQTMEHEYNNLKNMYQDYMKKLKKNSEKVRKLLKNTSRKVTKMTTVVKDVVTEASKKIEKIIKIPDHVSSKVTKDKIKNKTKKSKEDTAKITKEHSVDRTHLKDKVSLKDRVHFKDRKRINDKSQIRDKDQINKSAAFEAGTKFVENYVTSERNGRHTKHTNFKTADKVDKTSSIKYSHVGQRIF